MRNVLGLVLLVPILALAAGTTQPVTALAPENGTMNMAPLPAPAPADHGQPNIPPKALIGSLDTIGGTTYDWMANGPRMRMIANSPEYGVHAVWMFSTATTGTDFPDRNMRYNFYDFSARAWNWLDPDHMQSGVNVFGKRAGYGNLDADPTTGNAIVGCHVAVGGGSDITPSVARDFAPGAGIFEYCDSTELGVCQWPRTSVGQDGQINIFPITGETWVPPYRLSYSYIAVGNWPTFSTPVTGIVPSPGFPTHNMASSKVSSKVSLVWEISTDIPEDAYQSHSTDGGITWDSPSTLDPPVAFGNGSDSLTSFHISSLFPWYDAQDRFHITANLAPNVNDVSTVLPAQIWHYCPDNNPMWARIHTASVDTTHYLYSVGYNATLACRPNIGQDNDGNLFVAWEQFDTLNYEPTTSRARADIWASRSTDNGVTWGDGLKLTDAGTHSMRFPSIIDQAVDGGSDEDTVFILFEDDAISGFFVQTEGPATPNPVLVLKIPGNQIPAAPPAVAEQRPATSVRLDAAANPNPFGGRTQISYSLPRTGDVSLVVYDAAGRPVQTLASGRREAGRYTATWNAHDVAAGVYFYTLTSGKASITRKLILAD